MDSHGALGVPLSSGLNPNASWGVLLPVNIPSFEVVLKWLQKFDPSGHPSATVNDPSGVIR